MFRIPDHSIIEAFIFRESQEFNWFNGINGVQACEYRTRMFEACKESFKRGLIYCPKNQADFVEILSLTNMGQTASSLKLSPESGWWDRNGHVVTLALPNSPNGGVGVWIVQHYGNPRTTRIISCRPKDEECDDEELNSYADV